MTNRYLDSEEDWGQDDYLLLQHHWQQQGLAPAKINALHAVFKRQCLSILERRLPPAVRGALEHYWTGIDPQSNFSAVFALVTNLPAQRPGQGMECASSVVSIKSPFLSFEEKEVLLGPRDVAETSIATGLARLYLVATCQHMDALRENLGSEPADLDTLRGAPEGNAHESRADELVRQWGFDPMTIVAWREALVYAYKSYPEKKMRPEQWYPAVLAATKKLR